MKIIINNSSLVFRSFNPQKFSEVDFVAGDINMSDKTWRLSSPLNRKFKVVDVNYTGTVKIKSNATSSDGFLCFLSETPNIVDGQSVHYISGAYLTRINADYDIPIPDGTKAMYVQYVTGNGTNVAPQSIKVGNVELMD